MGTYFSRGQAGDKYISNVFKIGISTNPEILFLEICLKEITKGYLCTKIVGVRIVNTTLFTLPKT